MMLITGLKIHPGILLSAQLLYPFPEPVISQLLLKQLQGRLQLSVDPAILHYPILHYSQEIISLNLIFLMAYTIGPNSNILILLLPPLPILPLMAVSVPGP